MSMVAALSGCGRTDGKLKIERLEMSPLRVNTYVVGDEATKEAIIIDPGTDVQRIADALAWLGYRPKRIVATHGHIDHVAGAAEARTRFGVPFMVHEGDKAWIDSLDAQAAQIGIVPCRTPVIDRWLHANDELSIGAHRARILHTPGHSDGACSIVFDKDRVAFTGDTLFRAGVGRTDFRGGSATVLMSSIRSSLVPLGDDVAIHPGHGPAGIMGEERRRLGM